MAKPKQTPNPEPQPAAPTRSLIEQLPGSDRNPRRISPRDMEQLKRDSTGMHPTEKPPALAMIAIANSTQPDDVVLNNFGGSGTTMVACQKTGRRAMTCEFSPDYCAVQLERMKNDFNLTGTRI